MTYAFRNRNSYIRTEGREIVTKREIVTFAIAIAGRGQLGSRQNRCGPVGD